MIRAINITFDSLPDVEESPFNALYDTEFRLTGKTKMGLPPIVEFQVKLRTKGKEVKEVPKPDWVTMKLENLLQAIEVMEFKSLVLEPIEIVCDVLRSKRAEGGVQKILKMLKNPGNLYFSGELDELKKVVLKISINTVESERVKGAIRRMQDVRMKTINRKTVLVLPRKRFEDQQEEKLFLAVIEWLQLGLNSLSSVAKCNVALVRHTVKEEHSRIRSRTKLSTEDKKKVNKLLKKLKERPRDGAEEIARALFKKANMGKLKEPLEESGPVLFEGKTGVGKTLGAELFSRGDIVPINVAALPKGLIEARLRGTISGVATEVGDQPGWFEKANQGTLFLDEFQDAPLWVQEQILDVVAATSNEVVIARMGEEGERKYLDVKLLVSVSTPVAQLIRDGKLREDFLNRMRRIVPFETLSEKFKKQDGDQYIKRLLRIGRWRFCPEFSDLKSSKSIRVLFPEYDDSAVDEIRRWPWKGNYREFDRLLADVYRDLDKGRIDSSALNGIYVKNILNKLQHSREWEAADKGEKVPAGEVLETGGSDNYRKVVMRAITAEVRRAAFVLSRVGGKLAQFGMKHPKTVEKRIGQLWEFFDEEFRNEIIARKPNWASNLLKSKKR